MHLLRETRDAHPFADGNGLAFEPVNTARKTVDFPGPKSHIISASEISDLSLIVSWLLFLHRQTSDDVTQFNVNWGYRVAGGPDTLFALPSLRADGPDPSEAGLSGLVNELMRQDNSNERPKLGGYEVIYFGKIELSPRKEGAPAGNDSTQSESFRDSFRLEARSADEKLSLQLAWRGSTVTRHQAEGYLDIFAHILAGVLERRENPAVDLLGPLPIELDQIWEWNAVIPPKIDQCMHEIIKTRAQEKPNAPAVSAWDGEFTYFELDRLSTCLAHHLRSLDVGLGSRVPLCFEKSKWTVVAVLAVMKAGAAFALMDPSQPEARLMTMVKQTEAGLVLTSKAQEVLANRIASGRRVVAISDHTDDWSRDIQGDEDALPAVPADAPMYIQFTSGSTGKPKGIVISHGNYTSGAIPRAEAVGYKADLRVFEFASYAFDVCIDCIICTLATGGCVCVPTDEARMNDLSGAIRSSAAQMAHMTPSVARVLDPEVLQSLDVLGLGGEAVSASDAVFWNQQTKVVIAYGPSECTVGCTINNDVSGSKSYANIGKGVGGLTWIVDATDHNRLVPVGAVGELLIEGPILGIGYLNDPEKTSESFITDPSWLLAGNGSVPGREGRLYKTGDLVRYDPDGSGAVVFVGRKDQQVKLRGQRIELAEVEHCLRRNLPGSAKIVAEVISPQASEPTLVVFLAEPNKTESSSSSPANFSAEICQALTDIDDSLAVELPRYMLPSAYIPLAEIPSLVSGKTDRKKLREMGRAMTREEIAKLRIVASRGKKPETEAERAFSRAWGSLLGNDLEISASDSFFALGGDSLKAMKLVAAARAEGLSLTVASIFAHPTLREMAATAQQADGEVAQLEPFALLGSDWPKEKATSETANLCGIASTTIEDIYPCTPLQEALLALSAKFKDAYVAQRVLELEDLSAAQKLQSAFETATQDCAILRTRIVQVPGRGLTQVVLREAPEWRTGDSLQVYIDRDREEEMGLGSPLVRYGIVTESASGKVHFVWTVHHAIYDGWSMPLVVDRVNRAYQGLPTKRPAEFKQFIHYLQNIDHDACKAFWKEQLHGAVGPQFPALPWEGYQARPDSLLEQFVPLAGRPASDTTTAALIRGAWALVAANYAGSDDIVFGETLTGRNVPVLGVDELEGPMITTVPVRVQIDRTSSVTEYLHAVHNKVVAQMPYEHMGLQHIRKLSDDALEACELRTGLVLNPTSTPEQQQDFANQPASGLVPVDDAEAAQEALNFNTYGLMLVCSFDENGFLVMASFDSKMVDKPTMERALRQFSLVAGQLCTETDMPIGEIQYMSEQDHLDVRQLSTLATTDSIDPRFQGASAYWVVDPTDPERLLPSGAVGELLIEDHRDLSFPTLEVPQWLLKGDRVASLPGQSNRLFKTNMLAKINTQGSVILVPRPTKQMPTQITKAPISTRLATAVTSAKQRKLRGLWSRVLGLVEKDINLSDNFFRLGGDSISAMKLASEARTDGLRITVAQVFANRYLFDMAEVCVEQSAPEVACVTSKPFQSLSCSDIERFLEDKIRPALAEPAWKITDVLPTRPLQEIAVKGTFNIPRYSLRYEFLHFDTPIVPERLRDACQSLVAANEILRTVFVEVDGSYHGVVLEQLVVPFEEYDTDDSSESFAHSLCRVDVQARIPAGSAFVKWMLVHGKDGKSSLVFRISHAQYDELCLPVLLRQLSSLYEGRPVPATVPYSAFVGHVIGDVIPNCVGYWRDLLKGSSLTVLRPDVPVTARQHFAISKAVDISARSRDITVATLPTAAWALCLSHRLGLRDVTFGEVASGRNTDLPGNDAVVGPCWQYIPVRMRLEAGWTGLDLLQAVQHQHQASARFEGMALTEIVRDCTDWPNDIDWFDSVVHQDVAHVSELPFLQTRCRMDTLYVHEEPLREWKVQAYADGDSLTLEIVTFNSWSEYATGLLDDLVQAMEMLILRPKSTI